MSKKLAPRARFVILLAFLLAGQIGNGLEARDQAIVGVWLTTDASNEEGRRQGGAYFRTDGTGGFLGAEYKRLSNAKKSDELLNEVKEKSFQAANIPRVATGDLTFEYSTHGGVVTIHHKTFMGIKVSGDPKRWTYHVDRNMLRLTAAEEPNRWILLERAE